MVVTEEQVCLTIDYLTRELAIFVEIDVTGVMLRVHSDDAIKSQNR